jgi:hypothetical protein
MKHRFLNQEQLGQFDETSNLVHYEGVGQNSTMTLCGAVDWIGADWIETTKRVNCIGCIAVRKHVTGH